MTGISNNDNYIVRYFFRAGEQTKSEVTKLTRQIAQASGEIPFKADAIIQGAKSLVTKRN